MVLQRLSAGRSRVWGGACGCWTGLNWAGLPGDLETWKSGVWSRRRRRRRQVLPSLPTEVARSPYQPRLVWSGLVWPRAGCLDAIHSDIQSPLEPCPSWPRPISPFPAVGLANQSRCSDAPPARLRACMPASRHTSAQLPLLLFSVSEFLP